MPGVTSSCGLESQMKMILVRRVGEEHRVEARGSFRHSEAAYFRGAEPGGLLKDGLA